jgi:putative phage-type endonuclease
MTVVLPVRQKTPEWLAARENGIGASQAAAAIGLSQWQSPVGLWAEKLGLVPPQPENTSMRIGTELEPLIARMYTEATGVRIRRANNLRQHAEHPFMLASIDRRAGRKPIELKFSARATGYGEPGTDEVPDDTLVQVLHQLAVLDEPEGEVALLKPGADTVLLYRIQRSVEAEASIVEREAVFWDHVQNRTEPPVDGSEATRRALAAMYPRGADELVVDADPETAARMLALRNVRAEQKIAELQRDELEALIQAAMLREQATVIRAAGIGEIPWRATKDRETTDWKLVAGSYRSTLEQLRDLSESAEEVDEIVASLDLDAVEGLYTTTKQTAPRFGPPRWTNEEEDQ